MTAHRIARTIRQVTARHVLGGLAIVVTCALPIIAEAVVVDCSKGRKITTAVNGVKAGSAATIVVKGACTENVVINRDDITLTTDGATPASIQALDANQPAILLDGAQRIVIDGNAGVGINIGGGTYGVSATRGSTLALSHCTLSGNTINGLVSAYGSTVSIDGCTIGPNTGNGAVAANTASLGVTNSTVTGNTGTGLLAVRSSYLRVGQSLSGTATVEPVTVSGNGTGVSITESSSGTVVGGVIENSAGTNLFVGRGSSGQIGVGSNGLMGGVTVRNGSNHGISVEGANATIVLSTITGHAEQGIVVTNAGSARIGILNGNAGYAGNTISGNAGDGLRVSNGSSAFIGGNSISANGVFGIHAFQASAEVVGNNTVSNNAQTGIFVNAGNVQLGSTAFGLPTGNLITGNGSGGPNGGGLFAFRHASILASDATISNNTGAAVQAFEDGVIELRGTTAVTVPAAGSTHGALMQFGSTLRVRDTASVVSATGDGIQASNMAAVNIRDGNTVQGSGAGSVGIRCFNTSPMTASAATLTGNLVGVAGTTGPTLGCNLFP